MGQMRDDYNQYMDYINKIKTEGIRAAFENPDEMAGLEIDASQKRL